MGGFDPSTDDGDNDGISEDGQPQEWRDDLAQDGDEVVCVDSSCRALGVWVTDEGLAVARFDEGRAPMNEVEHAALLAAAGGAK